MLIGLSAVAIPILIHLLNRRRAKVVEWGAMRFLLAAMASRNRRIRLEEIILLALRCLWIALLVLAMAQPYVTRQSVVPWPLVLPAVLVAAILGGMSAVMWNERRWRWTLLGVAGSLLLLAGGSSAAEYFAQRDRWASTGGAKDVVIVIDGSTSMTLVMDGNSNFRRAVDEARAVVGSCKPSDAVAVLLGSSTPVPVIPSPVSDRKEIFAALDGVAPPGGTMQAVECLKAATYALARGKNPVKKIVVITDGQNLGWDLRSESGWQSLAASLKNLPTRGQVVLRTLGMPKTFRNLAAGGITLSRRVVGTDRPVTVDFRVANTGLEAMDANNIELMVDGGTPLRQGVASILPGATETVHFDVLLDRPGRHVLTARIGGKDDIPDDNACSYVVDVIDRLPVLVVDGAPSERELEGASAYLALALGKVAKLVPDANTDSTVKRKYQRRNRWVVPNLVTQPAKPGAGETSCLIEARVLNLQDLPALTDLNEYAMVVLANVPRLPARQDELIQQFVREGGGLLIAPGDRVAEVGADGAIRSFYNDWKTVSGEPVAPGRIMERKVLGDDKPTHLAARTFTHPALGRWVEPGRSDASSALVHTYWRLAVDDHDAAARTGGLFESGDPFLAERKLGKGFVLMTAAPLDDRWSNLAAMKCFVPMVHELAYYLAEPMLSETNVKPGQEITLPVGEDDTTPRRLAPGEVLEVITPSLQRQTARLITSGSDLRASFGQTQQPGLYRLIIPPSLRGRNMPTTQPGTEGVVFTVSGDAGESRLAALTNADIETLRRHIGSFLHAETGDELSAAISGGIPGEPLWEYLAIALLVAMVAEIALTRWIATQRRTSTVQPVMFGSDAIDTQTFRDRARELLTPAGGESVTARK